MYKCDSPIVEERPQMTGFGLLRTEAKIVGECGAPATVRYEGHEGKMSWVGYRCAKHGVPGQTLSARLTITKLETDE